jgi:hypothetical protein
MKTLLAAALMLGVALPAQAMTYSYKLVGADAIDIVATGDITYNENELYNAWMKTVPADDLKRPHATFVFDSAGGNVVGASAIAEYVHKYALHTSIAPGGQCISACVIAWGAGVHRSVPSTATVGVHGVSMDATKLAPEDAKNSKAFEEAWTFIMAQQLHTYAAPDHVVVEMVMTPSTDIYWLTAQDYADWGVHVID